MFASYFWGMKRGVNFSRRALASRKGKRRKNHLKGGSTPKATKSLSQSYLLNPSACESIVDLSGINDSFTFLDTNEEDAVDNPIDKNHEKSGISSIDTSTISAPHLVDIFNANELGALDFNVCIGKRPLVLEVGPGPGSLTSALLSTGADVVALEIDKRFEPVLRKLEKGYGDHEDYHANDDYMNDDFNDNSGGNKIGAALSSSDFDCHQQQQQQQQQGDADDIFGSLHLKFADALRVDHAEALAEVFDTDRHSDVWVFGNLPFNVASPLLIGWLRDCANGTGWRDPRFVNVSDNNVFKSEESPASVVAMFQKEVAQRIRAPPGARERSRLSVMCQTYMSCNQVSTFSGKAFTPPVKVDAEVVRLRPLERDEDQLSKIVPFEDLEIVVRTFFSGKRKMIGTSLSMATNGELGPLDIAAIGIDPEQRPADVPTGDWQKIASAFPPQSLVRK